MRFSNSEPLFLRLTLAMRAYLAVSGVGDPGLAQGRNAQSGITDAGYSFVYALG
jgi:hypothetical protein